MRVAYQLYKYDRKHRLVAHIEPQQSYSFVKAFLQILYCTTSELSQNIIDITNTSQAVQNTSFADFDVCHPGLGSKDACLVWPISIGTNDYRPHNTTAEQKGIIIGTGNTAVAVADDNLVTPIANGTSAGQMVYYGCWGLNYTTGASSASFDVERIFRNDSGGTIVVAEIGMYASWYGENGGGTVFGATAESFCILRDVLGATISVLNGEYLKVKYTITVSN